MEFFIKATATIEFILIGIVGICIYLAYLLDNVNVL